MKKILLISALSLFSLSIAAKDCFKISKDSVAVEWTAYKTPLKAPVSGKFRELGIENDITGKSIANVLQGISFNIDTASISTKNTGRDAKIVKFFFQKMAGGINIKGKTLKYSKKVLKVAITMNKTSVIVPLQVKKDGEKLVADGTIDLFDFNMTNSLNGINEACKELHQGKTWNDVAVKLKLNLVNTCN